MLLGERLGRGHQRALPALLDRAQQREEGDDGLARADLAHEQALHRVVSCEVAVDVLERVGLVVREGEREACLEPALGEGSLGIEGGSRRSLLAPRAPAQQRELDEQQLVEGEPAAAFERVPLVAREVQRAQRGGAVRQALPRPDPRGQRLERVGDRAAVLAHQREDARRVDPLACRVLRDLRLAPRPAGRSARAR